MFLKGCGLAVVSAALVGLLCGFGADVRKAAPRDEFTISDWEFEWKIIKGDDAALSIVKTQEVTRVTLRARMDSLWLAPKEAEEVGAALARTDEYWAKLKGSEQDVSEDVKAGKHSVTFRMSTKYGFSVTVAEEGRFMAGRVGLSRDQAKTFAPHLQTAVKMAAFVDRKVNP